MDYFIDITGVRPSIIGSFDQWGDHWQWHESFKHGFFDNTTLREATRLFGYHAIPMITWEPAGLPFDDKDNGKQYLDEMIDQVFAVELKRRLQKDYGDIYTGLTDIYKNLTKPNDKRTDKTDRFERIVAQVQAEFHMAFGVNTATNKDEYLAELITRLQGRDGEIYEYIRDRAQEAVAFKKDFLLRPFHEMNLKKGHYSWSVKYNDPEKIKTAWRLVRDVFREEKAFNAKFVWCVNIPELLTGRVKDALIDALNNNITDSKSIEDITSGDEGIDLIRKLDPNFDENGKQVGDYYDVVAVDGYLHTKEANALTRKENVFEYLFGPTLCYLRKLGKPIVIGETSAAPDENRAAFVISLRDKAPLWGVKAVIWFNENKLEAGGDEDDWPIYARLRAGVAGVMADNQEEIDSLHLYPANAVGNKNISDYINSNKFIDDITKDFRKLYNENNEDNIKSILNMIKGKLDEHKNDETWISKDLDQTLKELYTTFRNDALGEFREIKNEEDGRFIFGKAKVTINPVLFNGVYGLNGEPVTNGSPMKFVVPDKAKEDLATWENMYAVWKKGYPYNIGDGQTDFIKVKMAMDMAKIKGDQVGHLSISNESEKTRKNVKLQLDQKMREAVSEYLKVPPDDRSYLVALDKLKDLYSKWDCHYANITAFRLSELLYRLAGDDRYTLTQSWGVQDTDLFHWHYPLLFAALHPFCFLVNNSKGHRGMPVLTKPELHSFSGRIWYYAKNFWDFGMYQYPETRGFQASAKSTMGKTYVKMQEEAREKEQQTGDYAGKIAKLVHKLNYSNEQLDEIIRAHFGIGKNETLDFTIDQTQWEGIVKDLNELADLRQSLQYFYDAKEILDGREFARPKWMDWTATKLTNLLESKECKNKWNFPGFKSLAGVLYDGITLHQRMINGAIIREWFKLPGIKNDNYYLKRSTDINILSTMARMAMISGDDQLYGLCEKCLAEITNGEPYIMFDRDANVICDEKGNPKQDPVRIPGIQITAKFYLAALLEKKSRSLTPPKPREASLPAQKNYYTNLHNLYMAKREEARKAAILYCGLAGTEYSFQASNGSGATDKIIDDTDQAIKYSEMIIEDINNNDTRNIGRYSDSIEASINELKQRSSGN